MDTLILRQSAKGIHVFIKVRLSLFIGHCLASLEECL